MYIKANGVQTDRQTDIIKERIVCKSNLGKQKSVERNTFLLNVSYNQFVGVLFNKGWIGRFPEKVMSHYE